MSVWATSVVLPKLLSQSFNLLTPEERDTRLDIFHCSSLGLPPRSLSLALSLSYFALAMCSSAKHSLILSPLPPLFLFSLSSLSALCRILIFLSGDTNWKIAWGFPWAATPAGSLLISGNLRKLVKRVVTDSIFFCPCVALSYILSWWNTGRSRTEGYAVSELAGIGSVSCVLGLAWGFHNATSVLRHVDSLAGAILRAYYINV